MKMNVKLMIISALLVFGGIAMIVIACMPKSTERQEVATNWVRLSGGEGQEVEGKVVSSELDTRTEGARRTRHMENYYCPVYEYTVGGTVNKLTAVGDDCKTERTEVVLGSTATILYDEADPVIAFVKSDASEAMYGEIPSTGPNVWMIVLGAVLVLFGALGAWSARPKTPEQLQAEAEALRKDQEELQALMNKNKQ